MTVRSCGKKKREQVYLFWCWCYCCWINAGSDLLDTQKMCIQKRTSSRELGNETKKKKRINGSSNEITSQTLNIHVNQNTPMKQGNTTVKRSLCFCENVLLTVCVWFFFCCCSIAVTHALAFTLPTETPRDFQIFCCWILKWNFLQIRTLYPYALVLYLSFSHNRSLTRSLVRALTHNSNQHHSLTEPKSIQTKIWITVFW